MIQYIKDHGIKPVLSTLPPLCSERFFKWICKDSSIKPQNILKWLGDINAIYRYQEMYSREIEYIAFKTNTPIIDIRGAFLEKRHLLNYMCEDGMHPNEEGQKLIQQAFLRFLEQNKRVFSYC